MKLTGGGESPPSAAANLAAADDDEACGCDATGRRPALRLFRLDEGGSSAVAAGGCGGALPGSDFALKLSKSSLTKTKHKNSLSYNNLYMYINEIMFISIFMYITYVLKTATKELT